MNTRKKRLPLIVGIGGMNAAGRTSGFHSYKRMVYESLTEEEMRMTWIDFAHRMGIRQDDNITAEDIEKIIAGTLIRKMDKIDHFDPEHVQENHKAELLTEGAQFLIKKSKLPNKIPEAWHVEEDDSSNMAKVTIKAPIEVLIPIETKLLVTSGGNIPSGFDPGKLYNSHHHPRGLKLALYGAADLLNSLGVTWDEILQKIKPDEVCVYAGSAFAQVDENSMGGLVAEPLKGNRVNSKMLAMSLPDMPADFINSYVINSVGTTGANIGACATFLYNVRQAINDIEAGSAKVAIVGNSESCLVPPIIEGFRAMGALTTDEDLCEFDQTDTPNYRTACRPFAEKSGLALSESSQFIVIMDDELALELGMNIYCSIADIYISADANKKSISGPGVGNYVTFTKAVALAKAMLGQEGLNQTFVQAHGTGTPQNCTTESQIMNEIAQAFGITNWPVSAAKAYLGHSLSPAAGDQLIAALGVWEYGYIPGIKTLDRYGDHIERSNLNILKDHLFVGERGNQMKGVFVNSKGFGGNNATGLFLSPHVTFSMLEKKYGKERLNFYWEKNKSVSQKSKAYDLEACRGNEKITYRFGEKVMDRSSVTITEKTIKLADIEKPIDLPHENPYPDYF